MKSYNSFCRENGIPTASLSFQFMLALEKKEGKPPLENREEFARRYRERLDLIYEFITNNFEEGMQNSDISSRVLNACKLYIAHNRELSSLGETRKEEREVRTYAKVMLQNIEFQDSYDLQCIADCEYYVAERNNRIRGRLSGLRNWRSASRMADVALEGKPWNYP